MEVPRNSTLLGDGTRPHGNRMAEKTEETSWFAMEVALPSGINRAREECPFPVRFTEIYLPRHTIVSGPTGHLTISGGKYRIIYPDAPPAKTSKLVVFRDENIYSPDNQHQNNASHPGASSNTSTQPTQETLQQYTGTQPYDLLSDINAFSHEAMADEVSLTQDYQANYHLDYGIEGFFDEAMGVITESLNKDSMAEAPAGMVEAMNTNSTIEQQGLPQGQVSIDLHHTHADANGFQNYEYASQQFRDIFISAIVPEANTEHLRRAALNNEQLQNCLKFCAINHPHWSQPPLLNAPLVNPQTFHQQVVGTQVMGPFDNLQKQGFLTIRLPTHYRAQTSRGKLTSFDVPAIDGTRQAGGGIYSFYLPTSPPVNYELPYLHPGVVAALNLSKDHRLARDGIILPGTCIRGPHEIMHVDGHTEIVDCRDSSCLLEDADDQGKILAPRNAHDGDKDFDNDADSEYDDQEDTPQHMEHTNGTTAGNTQSINDSVAAEPANNRGMSDMNVEDTAGQAHHEDSDDQSPKDTDDQKRKNTDGETEEATDGEWDYLPKHMRPPQHRRAVMAEANVFIRRHRDWLYNEMKKETKAEEKEKEDDAEEVKEERKKAEKEELKRESELYRRGAYKEKTRRKRERDRWAQEKREADKRAFAAMMQQQEAAATGPDGTKTGRPQRRTARAAVDYREVLPINDDSSDDEDDSSDNGDESVDGLEDEEA